MDALGELSLPDRFVSQSPRHIQSRKRKPVPEGTGVRGELMMFDGLGSTTDEVVSTLRTNGIKGMPNTVSSFNPIIRFISKRLRVDAIMADIIKRDRVTITYADWHREEIPLPPFIVEFLARFDRGEYPDLILPSES
jgi:hypothetical protein